MDTNTISISNKVVFLDKTRGFSRFFKVKFPWISNVETYHKEKDFGTIEVNETDILFIVMTNPNDFIFFTDYYDRVKTIFIYMNCKNIVIEQKVKNNIFLIDENWIKRDIVTYIRNVLDLYDDKKNVKNGHNFTAKKKKNYSYSAFSFHPINSDISLQNLE